MCPAYRRDIAGIHDVWGQFLNEVEYNSWHAVLEDMGQMLNRMDTRYLIPDSKSSKSRRDSLYLVKYAGIAFDPCESFAGSGVDCVMRNQHSFHRICTGHFYLPTVPPGSHFNGQDSDINGC